LFAWVNYKKYFIEWLKKWWFNEKNILVNLDKISENSIILFEGKKAGDYLKKVSKKKYIKSKYQIEI